jgi:hypothetical protein
VRAPRDGPLAGLAPTGPRARWAVQQRPGALFCSCPGLPLPSLLTHSHPGTVQFIPFKDTGLRDPPHPPRFTLKTLHTGFPANNCNR